MWNKRVDKYTVQVYIDVIFWFANKQDDKRTKNVSLFDKYIWTFVDVDTPVWCPVVGLNGWKNGLDPAGLTTNQPKMV